MKRKFKLFFAWQDGKEETWLRSMSKEGWALKDYNLFVYTFEKSQSTDYIYKLDYKSTKNDDLEEYINLYKDAGWEHVTQFLGWHYFRIDKTKSKQVDIYSDNNSKIQKYKGLLYMLFLVLGFISIPALLLFLVNTKDLYVISIFKWLYIAEIALFIFAITKVSLRIKKLKG